MSKIFCVHLANLQSEAFSVRLGILQQIGSFFWGKTRKQATIKNKTKQKKTTKKQEAAAGLAAAKTISLDNSSNFIELDSIFYIERTKDDGT